MLKLTQLATVYEANETNRKYTIPVKYGLKCRVAHLRARLATGTADRDELLARRHFMWEPGYELPERCQIEIGGIRWNPVAGTHGVFLGPSNVSKYRRCDMVRVNN